MFTFNVSYTNNSFNYDRMEFIRGLSNNKQYNVIYCDKVHMLETVNKHSEELEKEPILGFDTETALTNYNIDHDKERPTIIQYGSVDKVIVINVSSILKHITVQEFFRRVPSLSRILMDKRIIKVGVDLVHDVSKLAAMGVDVDMYCDLQWMALLLGYEERGLNALADKVIGSQKFGAAHGEGGNSSRITTSHNWYSVSEDMIEYAARDVVLPLLIFGSLFDVIYQYMIAQLIPSMYIDVFYDLFDLSVIMVNHSKHNIKSSVSIRNFIIRSMNMFGIIVNTLVSEQYLDTLLQGDILYSKASDVNSTIPIYNNPIVFRPITRDDYINNIDISDDMKDKLDYYERQQRIRLITPEENSIINELMVRTIAKKNIGIVQPIVVQDKESVEKLMNEYPTIGINNANTLVNAYKDHLDNYNAYKRLPCYLIGEDKNNKILYESKIRKTYKTITNILQQYGLTPKDMRYRLHNIEDKHRRCIDPLPYNQQISLDDIVGLIPYDIMQSDIDSFMSNVISIQESLKYLNNLPPNPTKQDNILINQYNNKYTSNMTKLKNRVKRFGLDKSLFLRLPEPFAIE